ncbi:MAG: protein kinase [Deltaproteobacteria bacterium]
MSGYGLSSWMQDALRAPEPPLERGTRIGKRYQILRRVGAGGFGAVYEAVDRKLGRRVALKLMAPSHLSRLGAEQRRTYVRTFQREARITARLPHPNIVVVHDVKTARTLYRGREAIESKWTGTPFLVMELLEGETLFERIQRGALSVEGALELLDGLCQGVAYAHDSGIVHRDLKPANVFSCADGRLKVLDFGIATADERAWQGIGANDRIGTPGYMAPERVRGEANDERADVFAIGVIAYEMLSGERPFEDDAAPIGAASLRTTTRDVPPALDDLVRRCLAPTPDGRPASASAVLAEVRRIAAAHGVGTRSVVEIEATDDREPFPGLAAFREDQSLFFFGRSHEIRELVARMGPSRRWLAVEGASGVGKSSVVRAGLLPAIRCGWIAGGPTSWRAAVIRPGDDPAGALRAALGTTSDDPVREVAEDLDSDEGLLIVVDQLEELFRAPETRAALELDRWLTDAVTLDAPIYLVTTMRTDFAQEVSRLPGLGPLLNDAAARYQLRPLTGAALRQAIVGPAALTGTTWAPELPDRIIADAGNEPGSLPLVSHALRTLWVDCGGRTITVEAYERIGGLGGALARSADAVLEALGEEGRVRARTLMLALVVSGRDQPDVRRTIPYERAVEAAGGGAEAKRVLSSLADARLIVVADDHVDLVHEALLDKWPQLRRWVDASRRDLERREELRTAALAWHTAGRPEDGLPRGGQLAYYRSAEAEDRTARAFVDAAVAAEELRRSRSAREFRRRVFALSVALALALVLAVWAMFERAEAEAQRVIAERRRAEAKQVADRLVHDLDDQLARIPGTSGARGELLDTAGDLLDRLNGDDGSSLEVIASRVRSHRKRASLASRYEAHDLAVRELLEAERLGRRRVALAPDSVDAKLELAKTLRELHWQDRSDLDYALARTRNADARELLVPVVQADADDVAARRILIDVLGDQQSLCEGVGPFETAVEATEAYERLLAPLLEATPDDEDLERLVRMHVGRATLASRMGEVDEAFAELDRARAASERRAPQDALAAVDGRSWLHLRAGEYAAEARRFEQARVELPRALDVLEIAQRERPGRRATHLRIVVARCGLGEALIHAGELDAAQSQFAQALAAMDAQMKLDPTNPRFSYYFGHAHLGSARLQLARFAPFEAANEAALSVESFSRRWRRSETIDNGVNLAEALLIYATAREMAGDAAAARDALNEVFAIVERFEAWNQLARGRWIQDRAQDLDRSLR